VTVRHLDVGALVAAGGRHGEDGGDAAERRAQAGRVLQIGGKDLRAESSKCGCGGGVSVASQRTHRHVRLQQRPGGGTALQPRRPDDGDRLP
jgi:hypothetical protein